MDPERFAEHNHFWNEFTIQQFWNGQSFARVDEGNGLSYELARIAVRALARDWSAFVKFANSSALDDGGEAAAGVAFGSSLGGVIGGFLGPGNWAPRPQTWKDD
jgi:hypothetical protein